VGKVDLPAAAALCTDLSRVTDRAALSVLLARAASILDASGLILWMSAGEQLFAVLGHGYPPEHLARFGPIARSADNAAAAAWRTGRLRVIAGEGKTPGALVAPMFGPAGCSGILALEIRHGREQDSDVQAVAAMVAAQLATAVAAWPAASVAPAKEAAARSA
jgi:GAF domain-containing protein